MKCRDAAVVAVGLAGLIAGCSSQSGPRFTHTSPNQYIMFDNKTAQACWSGPVWHDSVSNIQTDMNDAAKARGETPPRLISNPIDDLLLQPKNTTPTETNPFSKLFPVGYEKFFARYEALQQAGPDNPPVIRAFDLPYCRDL